MFRKERQPFIDEVERLLSIGEHDLATNHWSNLHSTLKQVMEYQIDFDRKPLTPVDEEWFRFQEATKENPAPMFPLVKRCFPSFGVLVWQTDNKSALTELGKRRGLTRLGNSHLVLARNMDEAMLGLMDGSVTQEDRFFEL